MQTAVEISNTDDFIDSRDVIERLEALKELIDTGDEDDVAPADHREYDNLKQLADELSHNSEWEDGLTLISDYYFEDYARELAIDIGAISNDISWPATCIDWERAASELQMDYSSVTFDGMEYWYRMS